MNAENNFLKNEKKKRKSKSAVQRLNNRLNKSEWATVEANGRSSSLSMLSLSDSLIYVRTLQAYTATAATLVL